MARLTEKHRNTDNSGISTKLIMELDEYNDTKLTEHTSDILTKLANLEDLEEKIGIPLDVFIDITLFDKCVYKIENGLIVEFYYDEIKQNRFKQNKFRNGFLNEVINVRFEEFNNTWFMYKSQAEQKLNDEFEKAKIDLLGY